MNKGKRYNILKGVIAVFAAIALSCCSEKKSVKPLVKTFLEENLVESNFSDLNISALDSTFFVTDSLLTDLQQKSVKEGIFKHSLSYKAIPNTKKKCFVRVSYILENGKKLNQTFYIDENLTQVLAVKTNIK